MKIDTTRVTLRKTFIVLTSGAIALAFAGCGDKPEPKPVAPAPAPAVKPAPPPPPAAKKPAPTVDANKDGYVTKAEKQDFRQAFLENFRAADSNGDGGLTRQELSQAKGVQRLGSIRQYFTAMDTNADGKVTVAERDAWHGANVAK
jgi:hypothetical protein